MPKRGETARVLAQCFGSAVFTVSEAGSAGLTPRRLRLAAAAGAVVSLGGGKYYVPEPGMDSREQYLRRVRAAQLSREGSVAAGVSGAALWGLRCPDPWGDWSGQPVCLASDRRVKGPGLVGLSLAGRPCSVLDGMAVTDLVATACDTAGQLPAPHALVVVDDVARRLAGTADRQRLASPRLRDAVRERLAVALDAFPCPATARARSALRWADPAADSAPESALRGHLLEAGLPTPLANARFTGASGRRYYVDLSWPEIGLGVEVDGRVKYTDMAVVYREKLRQDDLQAAGLRIRRWAAADVAAFPAAVVAAIGRLLS